MPPRRYKGWWLFCPIWFSEVPGEPPLIEPRPLAAAPLYWLVEMLVCGIFIPLYSYLRPDWEPLFCFRITDKRWRARP